MSVFGGGTQKFLIAFVQITQEAHLRDLMWCSFPVNLFVITRDRARGFTLRSYWDQVCGKAPVPLPSIVAIFPVWIIGNVKTLPHKIFESSVQICSGI